MPSYPTSAVRLMIAGALVAVPVLGVWVIVDHWPLIIGYIQQTQSGLHRELAAAMRRVHENPGAAAWALVLLSFLYGVFHAAGPGHGKLIIATYLASHPTQVKHGLIIAALSSLFQGVTAVVAVSICVWLLKLSMRDTNAVTGNLELTSYILVVVLGLCLSAVSVRKLRISLQARKTGRDAPACGHQHHGHQYHGQGQGHAHNHAHDHSHHHALAAQPQGRWRHHLAMIASIGIRPCSGAILVLIFAFALNLPGTGALAVFAMSIGTALTVSALALLAIAARTWAQKLAGTASGPPGYLRIAGDAVTLMGGLVIIALGVSLVNATLAISNHPLL